MAAMVHRGRELSGRMSTRTLLRGHRVRWRSRITWIRWRRRPGRGREGLKLSESRPVDGARGTGQRGPTWTAPRPRARLLKDDRLDDFTQRVLLAGVSNQASAPPARSAPGSAVG